ncbi:hypothetical protein CKA38_01260 [Ereboglobus luteus]|uniref:Uncharacterized protein n=1 Tax=Ereboglobus luteus TaxID=1796921 RepID=A0A2U8DZR1_9BACT|nr:hypothetical protein CKA38_01260 [Ereboglobus luteus]
MFNTARRNETSTSSGPVVRARAPTAKNFPNTRNFHRIFSHDILFRSSIDFHYRNPRIEMQANPQHENHAQPPYDPGTLRAPESSAV